MEELTIQNIYGRIKNRKAYVNVPGSKSITNRALLLAALSDGRCVLNGALFSDDSRHFLDCIRSLGIEAFADEEKNRIVVTGLGGELPNRKASVYVGSAGTAARFITALLGLCPGDYHLDASPQMRKRPMAPLIKTLRELGCEIICEDKPDCFPFRLRSDVTHVVNPEVTIDIGSSSQFLSALLICGNCPEGGMRIHVTGTHGMSYINITTSMMSRFGVDVKRTDDGVFVVPDKVRYHREIYDIEPDMSAAAYFYAAAAILGIGVVVDGVHKDMLQGDIRFIEVLKAMGCEVSESDEGICVTGTGRLKGIDVDMHEFSDQAITLAAIAPYADSPTTIRGVGHIRHQESDRLSAIAENLGACGIRTEEYEDSIKIYPGTPTSAHIKTYDDHRLAMGFAVMGLRADGIIIEDPGCCRKTFENFFEVLEKFTTSLL